MTQKPRLEIEDKKSNKENKRRRTERTIEISDRKLPALTSNDISVVQEVISEHVSSTVVF